MIDWKKYGLTDIPFLAIPAIDTDIKDKRANGRLFCREIAKEQLEKLEWMISSKSFPAILARTQSYVLGNGKSAFLAAAYWDLSDKDENVLWAKAPLDPKIKELLTRILDSLVKEGKIKTLHEKLGSPSTQDIKSHLEKSRSVGTNEANALSQLVSAEEQDIAYVYSNIRRRIPAERHVELFGALLDLFYAIGEERFSIFIDQFETYVRVHRTATQRSMLSMELNDLLRAIGRSTTLVLTIHPEAEGILGNSAPEFETFIKIARSSIDLPQYGEEDLVKMVKCYLREFRLKEYHGDDIHPFDEKVVRYAAHRTGMNPRDLITSLRAGLVYGSDENYAIIDGVFVMRHHKDMFGGLENKWNDFKLGKFRYEGE